MERNNHHIVQLIEKFRKGTATADEIQELDAWYASFHDADTYTPGLTDGERSRMKRKNFQQIIKRVNRRQGVASSRMERFRPGKVAVGLVILLASLAGTFFIEQSDAPADATASIVDAMPGGSKAVLTLGDGTQINLDSIHVGHIANEDGIQITKLPDGQVHYDVSHQPDTPNGDVTPIREASYNTITTPAGGQYAVVLPDGTNVWLNASSSLRYPTRFSGDIRTVDLVGEAYFDVEPRLHERSASKIPFIVKTPSYDIVVVGTEFNVNAYQDEASVSTTLVSGRVDIVMAEAGRTVAKRMALQPNQQARLSNGKIDVTEVDVNTATAWKDGFFYFNNTDLYTLARQFSRWYNVDIKYTSGLKNDVFFGKIPRAYTLSEALKVLELGNVRFRIVHHPSMPDSGRKLLILGP